MAKPPVSNAGDGNVGVDVKWGVRQTLVADLTVNTDFAQVEDDQQVVNLSRFSVLFPEKRDFFLEGAETFNFANGSAGTGGTGGGGGSAGSSQNTSTAPLLFYSRRIGFNNGLTVPIRAGGRLLGRIGAVAIRAAQHAGRRIDGRQLAVDELLGGTREPRPLPAQPGRCHLHAARSGGHGKTGSETALTTWRTASIRSSALRTTSTIVDLRREDRLARGEADDDTSYRGRFDWTPDKYGLSAEYLSVGDELQSGGRLPASHRLHALVRPGPLQSAPGLAAAFGRSTSSGSVDYITDPSYRPESKEVQGNYQMDLDNSDTLSRRREPQLRAADEQVRCGQRACSYRPASTRRRRRTSRIRSDSSARCQGAVTAGHEAGSTAAR